MVEAGRLMTELLVEPRLLLEGTTAIPGVLRGVWEPVVVVGV